MTAESLVEKEIKGGNPAVLVRHQLTPGRPDTHWIRPPLPIPLAQQLPDIENRVRSLDRAPMRSIS